MSQPTTPTVPLTPDEETAQESSSDEKKSSSIASFFGIVTLNLRLPGIAVSLLPASSSLSPTSGDDLDIKRRIDIAVIDLQLEILARQCPQSWLPCHDNESDELSPRDLEPINQTNFHYEACFSVGDMIARERAPEDSADAMVTLPVLLRASVPQSKNQVS